MTRTHLAAAALLLAACASFGGQEATDSPLLLQGQLRQSTALAAGNVEKARTAVFDCRALEASCSAAAPYCAAAASERDAAVAADAAADGSEDRADFLGEQIAGFDAFMQFTDAFSYDAADDPDTPDPQLAGLVPAVDLGLMPGADGPGDPDVAPAAPNVQAYRDRIVRIDETIKAEIDSDGAAAMRLVELHAELVRATQAFALAAGYLVDQMAIMTFDGEPPLAETGAAMFDRSAVYGAVDGLKADIAALNEDLRTVASGGFDTGLDEAYETRTLGGMPPAARADFMDGLGEIRSRSADQVAAIGNDALNLHVGLANQSGAYTDELRRLAEAAAATADTTYEAAFQAQRNALKAAAACGRELPEELRAYIDENPFDDEGADFPIPSSTFWDFLSP